MKYLVMECHNSYAVLLDEAGQFVKAANMHYTVGQTVTDPVLMREKKQQDITFGISKQLRYALTSVTAAACMLLLCTGVYQTYMLPYSSLILSINPSVQMDLNRKGNVVELTGLNDDGIALLEGYQMTSRNRLDVTDELIDRAIDMGYLYAGGRITIQIDTPEHALFEQYGVELRSSVSTSLAERAETHGAVLLNIESAEKPVVAPDIDDDGWDDDFDDDDNDDRDNDFDDDDNDDQDDDFDDDDDWDDDFDDDDNDDQDDDFDDDDDDDQDNDFDDDDDDDQDNDFDDDDDDDQDNDFDDDDDDDN